MYKNVGVKVKLKSWNTRWLRWFAKDSCYEIKLCKKVTGILFNTYSKRKKVYLSKNKFFVSTWKTIKYK